MHYRWILYTVHYVLLSELLRICCLRRKLYTSLSACNIPTLSVFNQRTFSLDVRYCWSARLSAVKTRMGLFSNIKQLRLMCFATVICGTSACPVHKNASLQLIRFPYTTRSKVERQYKYPWRFLRYFSLSRRDCKYRRRSLIWIPRRMIVWWRVTVLRQE